MSEPNFQDRVKHKFSAESVTGTVIAKYPGDRAALVDRDALEPKKQYIDVRSDDDRIYWATPAENWEVVQVYEET